MNKKYAKISQFQKKDFKGIPAFEGTHKELLEARREELRKMPSGVGSKRKYKEFLVTGKIKKRK